MKSEHPLRKVSAEFCGVGKSKHVRVVDTAEKVPPLHQRVYARASRAPPLVVHASSDTPGMGIPNPGDAGGRGVRSVVSKK
jgi:hypothetical protein